MKLRCHCVACHFRGARGPVVRDKVSGLFVADACPSCGAHDVEVMTAEWREDLLERGERSAIREQGAAVAEQAAA